MSYPNTIEEAVRFYGSPKDWTREIYQLLDPKCGLGELPIHEIAAAVGHKMVAEVVQLRPDLFAARYNRITAGIDFRRKEGTNIEDAVK